MKNLMILFLIILFYNASHSQSSKFWESSKSKSKEVLKTLPSAKTIRNYNNKLPLSIKNNLIQYHTELNKIVASKSEPNKIEYKRLANSIDNIKSEIQNNLIVYRDTEATPGGLSELCLAQYDQCMQNLGCSYSTFCLCCIPCSIALIGCMADIITKDASNNFNNWREIRASNPNPQTKTIKK